MEATNQSILLRMFFLGISRTWFQRLWFLLLARERIQFDPKLIWLYTVLIFSNGLKPLPRLVRFCYPSFSSSIEIPQHAIEPLLALASISQLETNLVEVRIGKLVKRGFGFARRFPWPYESFSKNGMVGNKEQKIYIYIQYINVYYMFFSIIIIIMFTSLWDWSFAEKISLLKEHVFSISPWGHFFCGQRNHPQKPCIVNWKIGWDEEMQVHLADVARFSRFCDGMWLIRILRFFTDGNIEY